MSEGQKLSIEDPGELERIAKILPSVRDRHKFFEDVSVCVFWLDAYLHRRNKDLEVGLSAKESTKILGEISTYAHQLQQAFETLDRDTRMQIRRRANLRGKNWKGRGEERLINLFAEVGQLQLWSDEILAYRGKTKRGRPRKRDETQAVRNLAEIWEFLTGRRPTIITSSKTGKKSGPFLEFCTAVIEPVFAAHELRPPSVQALGQKVLYPKKKEEK